MNVRRGINHTQGKKKNITYIKEIIFEHSPISRVEIADMLGLTPATITNNVSLLLEEGLIQEIQSTELQEDNPVGRRPIKLEFIPDAKYVIGLEIAPHGIFLTVSDMRGHFLYKSKNKRNVKDYAQTLNDIVAFIEDAIVQLKILRVKILGIGIGMPGFIDRTTGFIKYGIWPEWENKNFAVDLSERISLKVCADNNASVRAVNVGLFDPNIPATFAYLFVSKGIACPLMIQNSVISRNVTGAGEIGHMVIDIHGTKCDRCSNYGCLETFAGEDAIRKKCAEAIAQNKDTLLSEYVKDKGNPTIEEIITVASMGDKVVNDILEHAVKYLAIGICNIIKFVSPEMVVVDAYIMKLDTLKEKFAHYVENNLEWNKVELLFKPFNEFGGAEGSAAFAIKSFLLDR